MGQGCNRRVENVLFEFNSQWPCLIATASQLLVVCNSLTAAHKQFEQHCGRPGPILLCLEPCSRFWFLVSSVGLLSW